MSDNAKELRLAFAMGGGVSLGTFSGAALSEVIKLSLLHGVGTGKYSKVTIDVFSGASAGAISLAIMLRGLVHRSPEDIKTATDRLVAEIGVETLNGLDDNLREQLIAAQVVQDKQREIWMEKLNLDLLLEGKSKELRHYPSIFNRRALDQVGREFVEFPVEGDARLKDRVLLGDRVLFACALSNMSPIRADGTRDLPEGDINYAGLYDAMRSDVHRELRVFDLNFKCCDRTDLDPADPAKRSGHPGWPLRWCRYHTGKRVEGKLGDLRENRAWSKITATAIAAGAFPVAFEPVVLTRSSFEFGDDWPENLKADPALDNRSPEEPFDHLFTYMDGGVFNNEPLREAFRLSSFLDANDDPDTFERVVVFVDPNVNTTDEGYALSGHREYRMAKIGPLALAGKDIKAIPSAHRILAFAAPLVQSIMDEARVNEADRAVAMRKVLEARDDLRNKLADMEVVDPKRYLPDLAAQCTQILDAKRISEMIPAGPLDLPGALRQSMYQNAALKGSVGGISEALRKINAKEEPDNPQIWFRALTGLAYELVADTIGKRLDAKAIGIAPIYNPGEKDPKKTEQFKLPAGKLFGFAGFMSKLASDRDFKVGVWCAHKYLFQSKIIDVDAPDAPDRTLPDDEQSAIEKEVKKAKRPLAKRLSRIIGDGLDADLRILGVGSSLLLSKLVRTTALNSALKPFKPKPARTYELRIMVEHKRYELDGPSTVDNDVRPLKDLNNDYRVVQILGRLEKPFAPRTFGSGNTYTLVTCASFKDGQWDGLHVEARQIKVYRDRVAPRPDVLALQIDLPVNDEIEKAMLLPNPIFICEAKLKADDSKEYDVTPWSLLTGVRALDRELLE